MELDRKILNNINQICKGMRINGFYTLYKDVAYMNRCDIKIDDKTRKIREDIGITVIEFNDPSYQLGINDILNIENGKDLYQLLSDKLCVVTRGNESVKISLDDVTVDIKKLNKADNEITNTQNLYRLLGNEYKLVHSSNITELYENTIDNTDIIRNYDIPNVGKFRLTRSLIKGLKKDTQSIDINIYEVEAENNIYITELILRFKKYTIKHLYKFIAF